MDCKKTESLIIAVVLIFAIVGIIINVGSADLVGQAYRIKNVNEFKAPRPSIQLYPSQGSSGDEINIVGQYFSKMNYWPIKPPYPVYTLMIGDEVIKTFTRSTSGKFKESFIIPSVEPGKYKITIKEEPKVSAKIKIEEEEEGFEVEWEQVYGGENLNKGYSVAKTSDGGYILAGSTYFDGEDNNLIIIKTDD